jgi:2-hydroxy-3-keto-5-methylthiopentenyl-1-phosphate phosphatase
LVVIADWDRTLTCTDSSSWLLPWKSRLFSQRYRSKRDADYNKYRPYETWGFSKEVRREKMIEWWNEHLGSLVQDGKWWEEKLRKIVGEKKLMSFREWVKEFLGFLKKNDIPLIIVSAGLGNLVYDYLEYHNIDMKNISIETNMLYFENGDIVWFDKAHIVNSANKSMISLSEKTESLLEWKTDFLILWDGKDDIEVQNIKRIKKQSENVVSIGITSHEWKPEMFDNTGFQMVNPNDDYGIINNLMFYLSWK